MKRYKLLGLLSIVPFVTSCHGFIISKEEGVKVINDALANFNENKVIYDKFTYFYNYKLDNFSPEVEIKVIHDKNLKFFYSYKITKSEIPQVYENWCYVKDNFIFNCHLVNSKKNSEGMFVFEPNSSRGIKYNYSNEEWNVLEKEHLSNGINKLLGDNLNKMKTLSEADLNIEYSSWNKTTSVAIELKESDRTYKCNIDNFRLQDLDYKENNLYEYFTVSYERAQIAYLNA